MQCHDKNFSVKTFSEDEDRSTEYIGMYGGREGSPAPAFKSRAANAKKTARLPESCAFCIPPSRGYRISFCIPLNPLVNQEVK